MRVTGEVSDAGCRYHLGLFWRVRLGRMDMYFATDSWSVTCTCMLQVTLRFFQ